METLISGLRATAKAEAAVIVPPDEAPAPLSAAERGDIVAAILAAPARAKEPPPSTSGVTSLAEARRRRLRWLAVATPLAAAAALALVLGPLSPGKLTSAPLPGYDVTATGGLKEFRGGAPVVTGSGATAPPERIARDTELTVRLRPATAVEGALAVRAFVVEGSGAREVAAAVELAPSGAAEARLRPGAAATAAGRAVLRVLIGRADDVRGATAAEAAGAPADANGRRWLTIPIDVAP